MSENSTVLDDPVGVEYEFEVPPAFLFMLGRENQCNSTLPGLILHGLGSEEQTRSVPFDGRVWLLTSHRHRGIPGLLIQVQEDGGTGRRQYFASWESLRTVRLILTGLVEV